MLVIFPFPSSLSPPHSAFVKVEERMRAGGSGSGIPLSSPGRKTLGISAGHLSLRRCPRDNSRGSSVFLNPIVNKGYLSDGSLRK